MTYKHSAEDVTSHFWDQKGFMEKLTLICALKHRVRQSRSNLDERKTVSPSPRRYKEGMPGEEGN